MTTLDKIFSELKENPKLHFRSSDLYQRNKIEVRNLVEKLFSSKELSKNEFGPFGEIILPYTKMGAIDSLDLFGLDELIIFSFYKANKNRYKNVIDIGANLGLHSIIMDRCGFKVKAFEPDPWHYEMLVNNLKNNQADGVTPFKEAVSTKNGEAEFVRVLGNTTGSHLAGFKNSYGDTERFTVPVRSVLPLYEWADFAKIDAEGHEKELLLITTPEIMSGIDIMVEIGNPENANAVFTHFKKIGVNMFSQKLGWQQVQKLDDIPTSHREGSLFISSKDIMPW